MMLAKNMNWGRASTPTPISVGSGCPVGSQRVGGQCVQQEKGYQVKANPSPVSAFRGVSKSMTPVGRPIAIGTAYRPKKK